MHTVREIQLHGFSDASQVAYGAVIYARHLHFNAAVTTVLLSAKTQVAPVKEQTIPRLELCGARLLAKLLSTVAAELNIPSSQLYARCDSTAVLGWLRSPPNKGSVFVNNRVNATIELIPATKWRYVSTICNPADLASRGTLPKVLLQQKIWWMGPPWLQDSPVQWPIRGDIGDPPVEVEDFEPVLTVQSTEQEPEELLRFSSLNRLVRFWAYARRWIPQTKKINHPPRLMIEEIQDAEQDLLRKDQQRWFKQEQQYLQRNLPVPVKSFVSRLTPFLDESGTIRIGGRLLNSKLDFGAKHPIPLHRGSHLVKILLHDLHFLYNHASARVLMALTAERFHIPGLRALARRIAHECVPCRRTDAKPCRQLMGPPPAERVRPAPPFENVGLDYAGPLMVKRGNPRKPVLEKAYVAVYVCTVTKAIHLELVSSLTTDAFLASFRRFVNRRGLPTNDFSDNGRNFVGAQKELQTVIHSRDAKLKIQSFCQPRNIHWHFIPVRSPHHGGLWEAGVREMKRILTKVLGEHKLWFEDLATILTDVEATLNSQPIATFDSHQEDGSTALTPGHFLVGRPLYAAPVANLVKEIFLDSDVGILSRD